jgi:hypothetical protein
MGRGVVKRLLGWLLGLIALVVLYAVGNAVLVGGQYLWHYTDHRKLDAIKTQLDSERPRIEAVGAQLQRFGKDLTESEARLNTLKREIAGIEKANPRGVPEQIYPAYTRSVQHYNALVETHNRKVAEQQVAHQDRSSQIDRYNKLVGEANDLGRSVGSTWYVIPMPRVGAKGSAK